MLHMYDATMHLGGPMDGLTGTVRTAQHSTIWSVNPLFAVT